MKTTKRILSLLLALVLCLGLAPLLPRAEAADISINSTKFPDANFRSYVSSNFDTSNDGALSNEEIAAVKRINVSNSQIRNLKGVEYFTALQELDCSGNFLTSLDISKNTKLKTLYCYNNSIQTLDLGSCPNLIQAYKGKKMEVKDSVSGKMYWLYSSFSYTLAVDKTTEISAVETCSDLGNYTLDLSSGSVKLPDGPEDVVTNGLYLMAVQGNIEMTEANSVSRLDLDRDGHYDVRIYPKDGEYYINVDAETNLRRSYKLVFSETVIEAIRHFGGDYYSSVTFKYPNPWNPFTDVKDGKYYYYPVLWAYYHDPRITSGATATSFGVGKDCTRAQIVTFLWKAAGAPEPTSTECKFNDVKPEKYYYKAVLWAVENKITSGTSATSFGVGKPCTREQAMTFLWKAVGSPEPESSSNPFSDVPENKYYYKAILWAVENKITGGVGGGKFGVGRTCTRAQIVTFLYKAYNQ